MQLAQPSITPDQALGGFVGLSRNTKLTYDEHTQLALFAQIIKNEFDEHIKTKAELAAVQEELKKYKPVEAEAGPSNPAE